MADEATPETTTKNDQVEQHETKAMMRFFSVDSNINMANIDHTPEKYDFRSRDFFLKVAQLLTGVVCVGLYAEVFKILTNSVTFLCFPNVVFSSFIIINAVIILSYLLGHPMQDILKRVFMSIGIILYFISATVTITIWSSTETDDTDQEQYTNFLLAQSLLSYLNASLYGIDLFFNVKKAVAFEI